jgi:predicted TIM-barrel fold metal-dependent hydrolase
LTKPIDVWGGAITTPDEAEKHLRAKTFGTNLTSSLNVEKLGVTAPVYFSPDELVSRLDGAGIEVAFIAPGGPQGKSRRMRPGDLERLEHGNLSYKILLPFLEKYPDRFRGLYLINPLLVMDGVKEMEMVVKEYGFIAALAHCAGFVPFNDKMYFPFYAKCVELDIPVIAQIGHYGAPMSEGYAHPLLVDDVAELLPELRIVAGHTGWPWCDDLIAVALKYPNVFVSMEAHLPKYWEASMVKYIDTRGRDKCMWGSDFPITDQKQNLEQVEQLGFREETKRKFLRENAIKVFKLDLPLS